MDLFDNEKEILSFFQSIQLSEMALIPEDESAERILQSIHTPQSWTSWIDSSAHNAPPPDFYNAVDGVMMDVMRVDDHGYKNKKGKTVNPTRQRDSQLMMELKAAGIRDTFPNAKVLLLSDTQLSTHEDHNYQFYLDNFVDIIESHKKKIALYKKNHPGYKVIFFVFDESSMYFSANKSYKDNPKVGSMVCGTPHFWFADVAFLKVIFNSEIDFLIWFTSYKHSNMCDDKGNLCKFPQAVVIRPKDFPKDMLRHYDKKHMMSTEV